jgi:hypothetical protein
VRKRANARNAMAAFGGDLADRSLPSARQKSCQEGAIPQLKNRVVVERCDAAAPSRFQRHKTRLHPLSRGDANSVNRLRNKTLPGATTLAGARF